MNVSSYLPLLGIAETSGFDEMLRLIGIAAIIHAVFKGIRSLIVKPAASPATAAIVPPPPPAAARSAPEADDDAIPSEIIAVIAAAISCFTDSSHRIVSIKRQSSTWERAGRQSVLTSHRIR